jgi:hypothetical protein
MAYVLAPKAEKKIPSNLGKPICNPWDQCYSILLVTWGQTTSQKMLKTGPQVFWALKIMAYGISV